MAEAHIVEALLGLLSLIVTGLAFAWACIVHPPRER